ncbi:MAG: UDP-N-acetylmuramate dehydrogenase [Lachnospiraceae bacterium]|nr:UDP-N-acetylmuramate dehydrogenase [Lachnospiraceae bacterium]
MKIYETLCRLAGREYVLRDEPMSRHTTFRVGGPADFLVMPDRGTLPQVIACCKENAVPFLVIGNGSNLLCGDGGADGVVIEIGKRMADIRVEGTVITAEAGALLSAVAARAAAASLTGLEFAAGIPGSVGGAAVMNAGAYGGEMKDVLTEVTVITAEGDIRTLPKDGLDLSYRHSVIAKRGYIVLSVSMELSEGDPDAIYGRMAELKEKRVSKQPLEYPSAGSTFKRPEGYFAGKLIEDAGLRGFCCGGAQVSEKHCGFVINRGNATAADVRTLMEHIQQVVKEQSGVMLEPEVKFVGKFM